MGQIAAFFDLDRTLIDENSGLLWAKHERRQGNITRGQLFQAAFWNVMYYLSLIDMETTFAKAVRHYRGVSAAELDLRTREWFDQEIRDRIRPGARAALQEHRAQGHPLVLLTNSTCFEARVATEAFQLDDWLANEFPLDDDGRLTGDIFRPLCYGPGKVVFAGRWAEAHGIDLAKSFFYTDSASDLPMLERVGQPRVVSPDPKLRRAARRHSWPILDW